MLIEGSLSRCISISAPHQPAICHRPQLGMRVWEGRNEHLRDKERQIENLGSDSLERQNVRNAMVVSLGNS